jgi:bifunctional DNase/RNase
MAELRIHAFSWCIHHQQPVVGLTAGSERADDIFWVGLTVEDAQALCHVDTWPPSGRRRVHKLVSDIMRATDSRISSIALMFNGDPVLSAQVTITSPIGPNAISCSSVDAILLATENHLPLMMDDTDWNQLQRFVDSGTTDTNHPRPSSPAAPDVFRDFIETLDLEQDRDL